MNDTEKIRTFKDLHAWQEAHTLVLEVYRATKKFPREELFGIVNQMRRAAVSVTSNIAEGFSRNSYRDKTQFYAIAQGSLTELERQLLVARDLKYILPTEAVYLLDQTLQVHKILNGLLKSSRGRV